jgi:hypothetical protein
MGGKKALDENLSQALRLQTVNAAAELPARLQVVRAGTPMGLW